MKAKRQALIREIVESQSIQTQEELAEALRVHGMVVTQATVSRDIKEMHLIKVLAEDGVYRYAMIDKNDQGVGDRLIRMLSDSVVDIQQLGGNLFERLKRNNRAVNPADVSPRAGQLAGDGRGILVAGQRQFAQQRLDLFVVRDIEYRLHARLHFAVCNQIPVRAFAEHQIHSVHDDGFARAGFAGHHVHARLEVDGHVVNQRKMMNTKLQKHRNLPLLPDDVLKPADHRVHLVV